MDSVHEFLHTQIEITKKFKVKSIDLICFFIITMAAIVARTALFSYSSRDYEIFLLPWFNELKAAGGLNGFGLSLGDYTPPYVYIMTLLTHLKVDSLISLKVVSCIFDFVGAFVLMRLVHVITGKQQAALLSYAAFLFAPTVVLNSALWAQCDIIFTTFLLLCVYYFTKERPFAAMIFFGIAFAFKLQAIFLAPLLLLLWLYKKMNFRHFFLVPAVYLVSIIPAFIMGRPLGELLMIYVSQSGQYGELSLNAPNLYMWLNSDKGYVIAGFGIVLCFCAVILIVYSKVRSSMKIDSGEIIMYAFLFSMVVPFLLPHMHERYFYVADVFAILYAFQVKKRIFVPIVVILSSLASYAPYLFGNTPIDLGLVALAMLAVICVVIKDCITVTLQKPHSRIAQ